VNKKIPRPPLNVTPDASEVSTPTYGFGTRSIWPLPPVGEAARRDPHVPDPTPGLQRKPVDQRDISPSVAKVGGMHSGGGVALTGQHWQAVYVKRLGNVMTRTLARNWLAGIVDARWRLGGVSYPPDYGYGPGYHGDAATLWPDNPQTYLRNPGIKPMNNVPQTFRYAPNMSALGGIQSVGPSIADVGNNVAPGTP